MSSIDQRARFVHLGLDVHKDTIAAGILHPRSGEVIVERLFHDEASVRRFIGGFPDRGRLWACYEAGPTGYGLARLLTAVGVRCDVVAPSLIPRAPGDRVKTDKRDCRRLARLHRAGELVAIRIPTVAQEAVRDLSRTRLDMVADLRRARQRLGMFLLRHGRVWRGGSAWTLKHARWVASRRFDDPALTATFGHYLATVQAREVALRAVDDDLAVWCATGPFVDAVRRLGAYRGITHLGGLLLASETFDWRRFPTAGQYMGAVGLVPSEYSSGASTRRGRITKAGNGQVRTQLVESAWSYQHRPAVGVTLRRRQQGCTPGTIARSWKAQQRLSGRFRALATRKNSRSVVAAAVARELAGFVWAEMTADDR